MLRFLGLRQSRPLFKIAQFNLADIGEGITECEIIKWFVTKGQKVSQFDPLCEVQSDKAAVEISSRYDGVIAAIHYSVGDMAKVGLPLVDIDTGEDSEAPSSLSFLPKTLESIPTNIEVTKAKSITDKSQSSFQVNPAAGVLATPAVRRVSRENNVTLSNVLGSGKEGRILKEDVMQFIKNGLQPTNSTSSSSSAPIPLSKFQKTIPHFGYSEEITIDNCQKIRNDINKNLASNPYKSVSKITNMSIYVKAMSLSLLDFPILNSSIVGDETNVMLQYHANHNIGIAMDTINGLIVPNIKNVNEKSILDVALELSRLVEQGKNGSLSVEDITGTTITLSNIGNIGGTVLHPVITSGQVCIGALGQAKRVPVFDIADGKEIVVGKTILSSSWNADHRVVDGATMARFVKRWKELVENPGLMLALGK